MTRRRATHPTIVALTGGPGGGKSELLQTLAQQPDMKGMVIVTEEAIQRMRFVQMEPRSAEFQCALVATQAATEDSLAHVAKQSSMRIIVSHRGTLDPCAFWQSFGHSQESFFDITGTTIEDHYRRYDLVIHMESAAVRIAEAYAQYPQAHRPENVETAAQLDGLLEQLWRNHPHYVKILGRKDMKDKLAHGLSIIRKVAGLCHQPLPG